MNKGLTRLNSARRNLSLPFNISRCLTWPSSYNPTTITTTYGNNTSKKTISRAKQIFFTKAYNASANSVEAYLGWEDKSVTQGMEFYDTSPLFPPPVTEMNNLKNAMNSSTTCTSSNHSHPENCHHNSISIVLIPLEGCLDQRITETTGGHDGWVWVWVV